jgi:hypothetical protein
MSGSIKSLKSQEPTMTKAVTTAKLVQVKLALAKKYENLAKVSKSTPKRKTMLYQAARHRRMAADLSRQ